MAYLKGKNPPTMKTAGALGDIYKDEKTGLRYKCAFAYAENDGEYIYEWKKLNDSETKVEEEVVAEPEVIDKVIPEVEKPEEPVIKPGVVNKK